jgi:hypothetical protein
MFADTPDGTVDRSGAQCGNFLEEFTGGGQRCESFSPHCPQIASTPLRQQGRIVDMTGALGILAAAATVTAVPALPSQGLVVTERGGLTFVNFSGLRLGHVEGLRFAWQDTNVRTGLPRLVDKRGHLWRLDTRRRRFVPASAGMSLSGGATLVFVRQTRTWLVRRDSRVILRMRVGREFPFLSEDRNVVSTARRALDLRSGRFVDVPRGCSVASSRVPDWILLCGRIAAGTLLPTSIEALVNGRRRLIAGPPVRRGPDGRIHGHWVYVLVSRDHRLLAQWSGQCEIPTAFVIEGRQVRPLGAARYADAPESVGLGWLRNGSAVIHFPLGACGGSFRTPGVYVVPRSGKPRLVLPTRRLTSVAMWGG